MLNTMLLTIILKIKEKQYIKKIIYHDQVGFIPGIQYGSNMPKSISVTHHVNRMKEKNRMIMAMGKELDKVQHSWMTKVPNQVSLEGTYLNTFRAFYENPTIS